MVEAVWCGGGYVVWWRLCGVVEAVWCGGGFMAWWRLCNVLQPFSKEMEMVTIQLKSGLRGILLGLSTVADIRLAIFTV